MIFKIAVGLSIIILFPILGLLKGLDAGFNTAHFDLIAITLNTVGLMLTVSILSLLIAVPAAWYTAACDIAYRKPIAKLLMLPLAIPSYILAFVYIAMLSYSSPTHTFFRESMGIQLPSIRSFWGLAFVMSLSLFPYIFSVASSAFRSQSQHQMEIAQSLGLSKRYAFAKLLLPMALPWISQGVLLVSLETLADFGAVAIFNFDSLSRVIYTAWYGIFSLPTASSIALLLLVIAIILATVQARISSFKHHFKSQHSKNTPSYPLSRTQKWGVYLFLGSIILVSLILPISQLLIWSIDRLQHIGFTPFLNPIATSFATAAMVVGILLPIGLFLGIGQIFMRHKRYHFVLSLCKLGYALPGTVLAVAIFQFLSGNFGLLALLLATSIRFLPVMLNPIQAAATAIPIHLDESAQSLGASWQQRLKEIHLPILKPSIITATLLTSIDTLKEMPIALMCRPFNWNTLPVSIFTYTEEGLWKMASFPALLLVMISILPVMLLDKKDRK